MTEGFGTNAHTNAQLSPPADEVQADEVQADEVADDEGDDKDWQRPKAKAKGGS